MVDHYVSVGIYVLDSVSFVMFVCLSLYSIHYYQIYGE